MFYSQFILAKKGPLGTIWIAAHLERKLRKNQVADTDIGVSVDSILFPEVPIALRLSSHLLLGVVRIYSRKVNYLFHDCSEALLKIKQAFRSTAVDLPPEESTAPYHSITLPETFDLDDFELPDSAALHGNFVDHHVSAREQITLQDNMGGTTYSTSQFGPDERFGDGDASQIGLDLDEELFNEKGPHIASALLGSEDVEHQISGQPAEPSTNMDIDDFPQEDDEVRCAETAKDMPGPSTGDLGTPVLANTQDPKKDDGSSHLHVYYIQTPDLNEVIYPCVDVEDPLVFPPNDSNEQAQAPSTPGLMVEKIPANIQEVPAWSPSNENSKVSSVSENPEFLETKREVLVEPNPVDSALHCPDGSTSAPLEVLPECDQKRPEVLQNGFLFDGMKNPSAVDQTHRGLEVADAQEVLVDTLVSSGCSIKTSILKTRNESHLSDVENTVVNSGVLTDDQQVNRDASEINSLKDQSETGDLTNQDTIGDVASSVDAHALPCNLDCSLRPCSSQLSQCNISSLENDILAENIPQLIANEAGLCSSEMLGREEELLTHETSVEVQGEAIRPVNASEGADGPQKSEYARPENTQDFDKPDGLSTDVISNTIQSEILNCTASSDYPEPERMVLAPARDPHLPIDIGQCSAEKGTAESDGSVDRFKSLSGQKRRLMDSTPVLPNSSTAKLSGLPRSKLNSSIIPGDNDLLASILVGRSSLKIKSTPVPVVASSKRPRVTPRSGAPKRKVLLDDTMVLHADAIRQQLINTEDIRRLRKKAPCTRPELWVIQKCLLEDEIFSEPVFTGMKAELIVLHSRTYELIEPLDSQIDANRSCLDQTKVKPSKSSEIAGETCAEGISNPDSNIPDGSDSEKREPSAFLTVEIQQLNSSSNCQMDIQEKGNDLASNIVDDGAQVPMVFIPHSENEYDASDNSKTEISSPDKKNDTEASPNMNGKVCLHPEQSFQEPVQPSCELGEVTEQTLLATGDACVENLSSVDNTSNDMIADKIDGAASDNKVPSNCDQDCHDNACEIVDGESLIPMLDKCIEVESDVRTDSSPAARSTNLSIHNEAVECANPIDPVLIINDQAMEEIVKGMLEVAVEDEVAERVLDDEGNCVPEFISAEELHVASSCHMQLSTGRENVSSAVGETSGFQVSSIECSMGVESTVSASAAARDPSDFCSAIGGHDTEFLNVDDDFDADEEADNNDDNNDVPNSEEAQSHENSGWSSRTRGVARYLKSLFNDESGRGRKSVTMDQLLAGKTRKEASRMFFETLVLKSRDYIHAEQEISFENINIKPRAKLIKSEF